VIISLTVLWGRDTSPVSLALTGIIVVIGIIYHAFYSDKAQVRRRSQKTKRKKIREVKSGEVVKVVGEVVFAGRTVKTSLSGRECSYYRIEVKSYETSNYSVDRHWHTIIDESGRGDIVLTDGTGYVVVQSTKAQVVVFHDITYTSGTFDDALPEMEALLEKYKNKSTSWLGTNKQMRFYEGVLEEGELCAVIGKAVWMPASKLKLNLPVQEVLVIRSAPQVEVSISDDPVVLEEP
jgi:hypothetical protein